MSKNYFIACLGVLALLLSCESAEERSAEDSQANNAAFMQPLNSDSNLPVTDTIMPEFPARRIPMNFMEHSEPLPPFNDLSD